MLKSVPGIVVPNSYGTDYTGTALIFNIFEYLITVSSKDYRSIPQIPGNVSENLGMNVVRDNFWSQIKKPYFCHPKKWLRSSTE